MAEVICSSLCKLQRRLLENKYLSADKSLARPGTKQARYHVTDARLQQHRDASCHQDFFFLQSKALKEIHAILTDTLACFLPGQAKDLSAPL